MNRKTTYYSYQFYYFIAFSLIVIGITTTSYLALSHYRNYTDLTYASFCALSKSINCDTVSQSSWSVFLDVPVALWGLAGYLLYTLFLVSVYRNTHEGRSLWSILQILGILYSAVALAFGYISARIIHSYCLMCITSYAVSLSLLLLSVMVRKRFANGPLLSDMNMSFSCIKENYSLKISLLLIVALFVGLKFVIPHYWVYEYPPLSANVSTGFTDTGSPWIGAEKPQITIEEFTDFQCFQCSKLHSFLRRLIEQHPEKIRLVHHHYPLDHNYNPILIKEPLHVGSGEMALLAIYASMKGKFWEMNDELYAFSRSSNKENLDLTILSKKLNLPLAEIQDSIGSKDNKIKLALDIEKGLLNGITGTPAYIIDGKIYQGSIPNDIFQRLTQ
jgi:uncharacterized membrane protein/protein-disulfide isomerase